MVILLLVNVSDSGGSAENLPEFVEAPVLSPRVLGGLESVVPAVRAGGLVWLGVRGNKV